MADTWVNLCLYTPQGSNSETGAWQRLANTFAELNSKVDLSLRGDTSSPGQQSSHCQGHTNFTACYKQRKVRGLGTAALLNVISES